MLRIWVNLCRTTCIYLLKHWLHKISLWDSEMEWTKGLEVKTRVPSWQGPNVIAIFFRLSVHLKPHVQHICWQITMLISSSPYIFKQAKQMFYCVLQQLHGVTVCNLQWLSLDDTHKLRQDTNQKFLNTSLTTAYWLSQISRGYLCAQIRCAWSLNPAAINGHDRLSSLQMTYYRQRSRVFYNC